MVRTNDLTCSEFKIAARWNDRRIDMYRIGALALAALLAATAHVGAQDNYPS
jgi:hypothetical protein